MNDTPQIIPITNKQIIDLTGKVFGRLSVLGYVGSRNKKALWLCKCECGHFSVVASSGLRSGGTQSCGCLAREHRLEASTKHGMAGTPEWQCWVNIIGRCTNAGGRGYQYWGGRGICICDGWRHSFENFFADMGEKPGRGHEYSIDRIDTDGHYSCGHCEQCQREGWAANCRWATLEEQLNNTRRNSYLEYQGERMTIKQWAKKLHVHHDCLYYRIRVGWSVEKTLTTPAKRYDG